MFFHASPAKIILKCFNQLNTTMKTVLGKVALQSYYNEENNRGPLLNL
jgi:hypothetical protein